MKEMRERLMRVSRGLLQREGRVITKLEVRAERVRKRVVRNEVRQVASSQII